MWEVGTGTLVMNGCRQLRAAHRVDWQGSALTGHAENLQEFVMSPSAAGAAGSYEIEEEQVSELSSNGFMKLDETTYEALQIFQVDKHPSSMGIGRSKEGFSVYGLLNKCVTVVGRRLMRLWFLRPILDLAVLNDRLDTISFLLARPEVALSLHNTLKRVKDLPQLLKKFSAPNSLSTSSDWMKVVESVSSLLHLRKTLSVALPQTHTGNAPSKLHIINRVVEIGEDDLVEVLDLINGVIDFDRILGEQCDTLIRHGISQELDELKEAFEGLPDFLNWVASAELRRLQHLAPQRGEGCIVYIPQVGYLMHFAKERLGEHVLENLSDFEFAFEGGENDDRRFFYHTSRTRQLDEMLGDIHHRVVDMEQAILHSLQARVCAFAGPLTEATSVAAGLDCLLAFSKSAAEYKCNRPDLSEENILIIKNGRHLLQEQLVDRFVPNDTVMKDKNTGRIHVITGPNSSGKSIYLKQVALIVFLAHVGSYVPADEAIIGLTDRIFTRIAGKETVQIPRSAFMIDLYQISVMLMHATSRSLCLIDEFGKGTLTTDGIGLLCATLKHLAASDIDAAPKVFATTHFSEVYNASILPQSINISFYTMGIVESGLSSNGVGDIVFLYRLVHGRATPSYGLHCAEIAGIRQEVLCRAAEVVEVLKCGKPVQRLENSRMTFKDTVYKELARKLAEFDAEAEDVNRFLSSVFSAAASLHQSKLGVGEAAI